MLNIKIGREVRLHPAIETQEKWINLSKGSVERVRRNVCYEPRECKDDGKRVCTFLSFHFIYLSLIDPTIQ